MRVEAKAAREVEDNKILERRMKLLRVSQQRKETRLEQILHNETVMVERTFAEELTKVKKRQEQEFLRVLESASRRAIGRYMRIDSDTCYVFL